MAALLCATATANVRAAANVPDFDRYQIILVRQPFGVELPPPAAAASNAVPADSAARNLKMTALVRDDWGHYQVGITDNRTKKNYMIPAGGQEDNIAVVEADYDGERVHLRNNQEDYWLSMDGEVAPVVEVASAPSPQPTEAAAEAEGSALSVSPPRSPTAPASLEAGTADSARWRLSYAERRKLREEDRQKKTLALQAEVERRRVSTAGKGVDTNHTVAGESEPQALTPEQLAEALRAYGVEAQSPTTAGQEVSGGDNREEPPANE